MPEESKFKLWSELYPEVKPKIRRSLRWFYFKRFFMKNIKVKTND